MSDKQVISHIMPKPKPELKDYRTINTCAMIWKGVNCVMFFKQNTVIILWILYV